MTGYGTGQQRTKYQNYRQGGVIVAIPILAGCIINTVCGAMPRSPKGTRLIYQPPARLPQAPLR